MLQEERYNNMLGGKGILLDKGKSKISREDDFGPDFYRMGEVSSKAGLQSS